MKFFNTLLVMVLFVAMSQMSGSDAHAGRSSRAESGEQDFAALVANLRAAVATTPPACTDGKHDCIDCTMKGKCDVATGAGTLTPDGECPAGEACIVVGSTPVCKPIAETECNCGSNSKRCDAFANRPIFCVGGKVYLGEACDSATNQQCSGAGECVAGSTTAAPVDLKPMCTGNTGNNFRPLTPACTTGVFCDEGEPIDTIECKETEYFDLEAGSCKAFPPPNPCGCGQPKCPIISNCTNYAVCDGDTLLDEESCTDATNNKFDFDAQACGADAKGLCADYEACEFPQETSDDSSSSTDSPSTDSPSTDSPSTDSPSTDSPSTDSPSTDSPSTDSPSTDSPSTDSPSTDSPSTDSPSTDSPTTVPATTVPATTTTTKPSTCNASNVGRRYPHETDKCKKYYTCRLISRTRYGYVEGKCIGNLVFNPANTYCDSPDNVPDCKQ